MKGLMARLKKFLKGKPALDNSDRIALVLQARDKMYHDGYFTDLAVVVPDSWPLDKLHHTRFPTLSHCTLEERILAIEGIERVIRASWLEDNEVEAEPIW